jgi:hypothetical protein
MPIWKYLLWVGGGLLALLFVADVYLPKQPAQATAEHVYNIPIASTAPRGPPALTFSGETRHFGPPPPMTVVDFSAHPNAAEQTQDAQAMLARAETAATPSATQSARPARPKVAKRKVNRQREFARRDPAHLPDGWGQDRWRQDGWRQDGPTGLAFAKPTFW